MMKIKIVSIFLVILALAVTALNFQVLQPQIQQSLIEHSQVSAKLKGKQAAFDKFKKQIATTPAAKESEKLVEVAASEYDFLGKVATVFRQQAVFADLNIIDLRQSAELTGTSRTPELLPMPAEIATEYYFSIRGTGNWHSWINFIESLSELPLAVSYIKAADGEWQMNLVLWRLR